MTGMRLEVENHDVAQLIATAIRLEDRGETECAISLYKIGVALGDPTCMTRLADMLSEPPAFLNVSLAEDLYKRACVAGHAPGCRNLAILYKQLGKSTLHDKYMRFAKDRGDVWQVEE